MSKKIALLSAGALCLLLIGGLWLGLERRNDPPPSPGTTDSVAPTNRAHEKAMLVEQLKKKPGHAPVLLRLAQLATEDSQPAEARRLLELLLRTEPSHLEARLELGRACYQLNDLACATTETERILAADPNHVDALYNLGAISANVGQNGAARQYWKRAVESAPSSESGKKAAEGLRQLGGRSELVGYERRSNTDQMTILAVQSARLECARLDSVLSHRATTSVRAACCVPQELDRRYAFSFSILYS